MWCACGDPYSQALPVRAFARSATSSALATRGSARARAMRDWAWRTVIPSATAIGLGMLPNSRTSLATTTRRFSLSSFLDVIRIARGCRAESHKRLRSPDWLRLTGASPLMFDCRLDGFLRSGALEDSDAFRAECLKGFV